MLRKIQTYDVGLIIEMLLALHIESPEYNKVQPDEPYVHTTLTSMIQQPNFIGRIDTDLRGFIFGVANRAWYDSELNAYELLLYVLPEYRGTTMLAPRLIKQFEIDAKHLDCIRVRAGVSTGLHVERSLTLYERMGYKRDGNALSKRIQ